MIPPAPNGAPLTPARSPPDAAAGVGRCRGGIEDGADCRGYSGGGTPAGDRCCDNVGVVGDVAAAATAGGDGDGPSTSGAVELCMLAGLGGLDATPLPLNEAADVPAVGVTS